MKALLIASALLAGYWPTPVAAQKAALQKGPLRNTAPQASPIRQSNGAGLPDGVKTEFCDDYARYYADLPADYKYRAEKVFQNNGLALSVARLEDDLMKRADLRQQVYKTLYEYCREQHGLPDGLNLLVYQVLYHQVRMTKAGASVLTMHIMALYGQPSGSNPAVGVSDAAATNQAPPAGRRDTDVNSTGARSAPQGLLADQPSANSQPRGDGLSMSGWEAAVVPKVAAIDDMSGIVRFRIQIDENGEVAAVAKVAGNVSPAQEKLCRDALQNASFRRIGTGSGGATGYYTFRVSVQ